MDSRRSLLVLAFAALAFWFAEGAVAIHGVGVKKSISWPYGSSLDCVLGVGQATLTFVPDAQDPDSGSVILRSGRNKWSTCDVVSNAGKKLAKFRLDIKASNVKRTCTSGPGPNTSIATFTQECGAGADTMGTVTEVSGSRVLRIGGMDVLKQAQCKQVFPDDTTGSQRLGIGVTLVTQAYYKKSSNCTGKKPADDTIVLRMCNGYLDTSGTAPSCLDAQGKPKKPGKGDLEQYDPVGLACQQDAVKQNCDADPAGVVQATIDGKYIDVRSIDTDSLACGDTFSAPAAKFQFGSFIGDLTKEDLSVTCPRCANGQLVAADGKLVVTGDTKGVKLEKDPKFAVSKFGGSCGVTLAP